MKSVCKKDMLGILGYSDEQLSENYSVQIDGTSAIKFEYVAFSDRELKDVSTSCIAVQEVINDEEETEYLQGAKYLATPIVIIFKNRHVRVWNIMPQKATLLKENEEDIIHLYFTKNRFEFMPENLIDAKMGYKQLDIFETSGLIDFSRQATCKILSEEFEKGLIAAKRYLKKRKRNNSEDLNNITSITIHVIAALIMNSKIKSDEKIPDIFGLLINLSQTYKEYFSDKLMFKYGKELLAEIYEELNPSINYQSVDHELLGYFYESTLLQLSETKAENIRKEFGIYYTPRILSQEIVLSIPFESIPVDERYVLDGTCGSGSLLLSACKRLEDLVGYDKTGLDKYEYLSKMIEGYDIDKFASEVARLSLLLYSLPYGNKWNIYSGDLLQLCESKVQVPYIILGNPLYKEIKEKGKRIQRATAFLDRYLDWLHDKGYIGIILPESFLQNGSSVLQREKLLNEFDIIELWMLPGKIFENNCSTIVIIAQKSKAREENLTKIKVLVKNKNSIGNYFKRWKWDFEFFVNMQKVWKKKRKFEISVSPVEDVLQKVMKVTQTVGNITDKIMGIKLPSDYASSESSMDGWVPYIANAKHFRRYVISKRMLENVKFFNYHMSEDEEKKIKQDNDRIRLRKDYERLYSATNKVLVKMSSTPGEINCISAFVEEDGYYPGYSFYVLISKEPKISNYVLCTLINSKLMNAFVRRECVKRTLTTDAVKSIPVPRFCDEQIEKIEQYFLNIKEACALNDEKKIEEIQEKMDDIIFDAFELTQNEREKVRKLFYVYTREEDSIPSSNAKFVEYQNVSGQVEEIDIGGMICHVFLVELGEQEIKIEKTMPGWFLRKGAEFSAKYHAGKLFDIKPLVYSYLDDDELIAQLSNGFFK
ncbi:hypothetical protein C806_02028 [Lachnospiraceae bacterium 3-1]|nr:hypothetical protein C806_02028 [Lachnospiraceae bacterium 3-1]